MLAAEELPGIYGTYDGAFDVSPDMSFADARTTWEAEIAIARKNCAEHSLDDTRPFPHGGEVSLRWIYHHMITEYARHCGHADLIRERIDGTTGA